MPALSLSPAESCSITSVLNPALKKKKTHNGKVNIKFENALMILIRYLVMSFIR